jgi:hypothetical protein
MRPSGINSGKVLDSKRFLKVDSEKAAKKKINLVNEP